MNATFESLPQQHLAKLAPTFLLPHAYEAELRALLEAHRHAVLKEGMNNEPRA